MTLDFNDAPEQRVNTVIPDGSFVRLVMNIRPGGVAMPNGNPADATLLTASKRSDALGLDSEFTVTQGEHIHRKLFAWLTVAGGTLDEKGNSKGWNMTKPVLRAMIDSAMGLDPKDMSPKAKTARVIEAFSQLSGIEFWAKVGVEPGAEIMNQGNPTGTYYDPKNIIERVVVPGDPEYADLVAGRDVPPKPKGAAHVTGAASGGTAMTSAKPAWSKGPATPPNQAGQPAAQQPAQPALPATAQGPAWLRK